MDDDIWMNAMMQKELVSKVGHALCGHVIDGHTRVKFITVLPHNS